MRFLPFFYAEKRKFLKKLQNRRIATPQSGGRQEETAYKKYEKLPNLSSFSYKNGGQGGIRTRGTIAGTPDFESCRLLVSESHFWLKRADP